MNYHMVCVLTVVLLLVGCTPDPNVTSEPAGEDTISASQTPHPADATSQQDDNPDEAITQSQVNVSPPLNEDETDAQQQNDEVVIQDETLALVDEYFKPIERTDIFPSMKTISFGETHVFAYAVQNKLARDDEFLVRVTYKEANDRYHASISEKDDFASSWIARNTYESTPIGSGDREVFPIVVDVKETSDGEHPVPGDYVFSVEAYYKNNLDEATELYERKDLTIKIPRP